MDKKMTTDHQDTPTQELKFLRPADVIRMYKISQSALYRGIKAGTIPEPTRISPRFIGWAPDKIDAAFRA